MGYFYSLHGESGNKASFCNKKKNKNKKKKGEAEKKKKKKKKKKRRRRRKKKKKKKKKKKRRRKKKKKKSFCLPATHSKSEQTSLRLRPEGPTSKSDPVSRNTREPRDGVMNGVYSQTSTLFQAMDRKTT